MPRVRFNDPAEKMMGQYPQWQPSTTSSNHRLWRWTDSAGTVHTIGCGAGTHSPDDAAWDAKMLKQRLNRCMGGGCDHVPAGILSEDQITTEPQQPLFYVGQQVTFGGQPTWITEMDGNLAVTLDAQGNEEIAPVTQLRAAASDFVVETNILDPVQGALDPKVWVHPDAPDPQLQPKLNDWLHKVIYGALERNGYEGPARWLKLVMTGSLCTYQYSDSSDCDVSLFIHGLPEWSRGEMIGIMVKEFDGILLPGTSHDIQAFVVSKTLTPQDLYKPGLRSAYDLETGKWIVPPDHAMAHDTKEEYPAEMTYGYEVLDKMDRLLKYEPDKAVQYYNVLHRRRQRDQTAGKGDFSGSNIAYKMLMNRGYGDRLRELGVHIY